MMTLEVQEGMKLYRSNKDEVCSDGVLIGLISVVVGDGSNPVL